MPNSNSINQLNRVEKTIIQCLSTSHSFEVNARISIEAIIHYTLIKANKYTKDIERLPLSKKIEHLGIKGMYRNKLYYVMNYGNSGAHYNPISFDFSNNGPYKIALSDIIRHFYKSTVNENVPKNIEKLLSKSVVGLLELNQSDHSNIISAISELTSSVKYNQKAFLSKLKSLIDKMFSFILLNNEGKISPDLKLSYGKLDIFKTLNFFRQNGTLDNDIYPHFNYLVRSSLSKKQNGKESSLKEIIDRDISSILDTTLIVIDWFHRSYAIYLPNEVLTSLQSLTEDSFEKNIMGWLIPIDNPFGMSHGLKVGENVIGRQSVYRKKNDKIVINSLQVSKNHAQIFIAKKGEIVKYHITDKVPSTNKTYLNNSPTPIGLSEKIELEDGDIISLGANIFKFMFKAVKPLGKSEDFKTIAVNNMK